MSSPGPTYSVRSYGGEAVCRAHDHARIMFAPRGRIEIEVGSRLAEALCETPGQASDGSSLLPLIVHAPEMLARRGIDPTRTNAALDAALHEAWPTARIAALILPSPQRLHA